MNHSAIDRPWVGYTGVGDESATQDSQIRFKGCFDLTRDASE